MTQRIRFYLIKSLLLCLLFKPMVYSSREHFGQYLARWPFNDADGGDGGSGGGGGAVEAYNRRNDNVRYQRNFNYHPYQPYQPRYAPSHQLHRYPVMPGNEPQNEQRSETLQSLEHKYRQRSLDPMMPPASSIPLPYQGRTEQNNNNNNNNDSDSDDEEEDLEEKIRKIFAVSEDDLEFLNTTLNSELSKISYMHVDESLLSNNANATDSLPSQSSSLTTRTTQLASQAQSSKYTPILPSSASASALSPSSSSSSSSSLLKSSAVNSDEPSFKVQRAPDGKLSLVFNDKISLQSFTERRTTQSKTIRDEIIFPEPIASVRNPFDGCEEIEGGTLCKKVRDYPTLPELDSRGLLDLRVFFTQDVEAPTNISSRIGGDPVEYQLCNSSEEFIFPEKGQTSDSRWLYIAQDPKRKLTQRVRIEKCIDNEQACRPVVHDNLPNKYRSVCKQSYVYRSLVALDNETYVKEQFKIPSCCKCVLMDNVRN